MMEKVFFLMLSVGNNITVQEIQSLYGFAIESLKMEKLNEGVTNLAGIDKVTFIIIKNFGNSCLIRIMWFDKCTKYEYLTDKIQTIGRHCTWKFLSYLVPHTLIPPPKKHRGLY